MSDQTTFTIRPATPADIDDIVRITNAAYIVEQTIVAGERTDAGQIRAAFDAGTFFVVTMAQHVCASVYCEINQTRGYFGLMAVDPAYQGHGLARALIEHVGNYCRQHDCAFLDISVISVRTELFPFYRRLGFASYDTKTFHSPDLQKMPFKLIQMTKALREDQNL